jgi:hypothetical protein
MAKFISTNMSVISGTIGGTTYSQNASGPFARRYNIPRDPNSPIQSVQRSSMSDIAKYWRQLTDNQRTAWVALGKLYFKYDKIGILRTFSGYQMYMFCQLNLNSIAFPILPDAPSIDLNVVQNVINPQAVLSDALINYNVKVSFDSAIPGNAKLIIESSGVVSSGVSKPSSYKKLGAFDNVSTSPINLTAAFINVFGQIPYIGDKVFFRCWVVDELSGFTSPKKGFYGYYTHFS